MLRHLSRSLCPSRKVQLLGAFQGLWFSFGGSDNPAEALQWDLEEDLGELLSHLLERRSEDPVLQALSWDRECTNEAFECVSTGAIPTTATCFTICVKRSIGCRSCCLRGQCYSPPSRKLPLGTCVLCSSPPPHPPPPSPW